MTDTAKTKSAPAKTHLIDDPDLGVLGTEQLRQLVVERHHQRARELLDAIFNRDSIPLQHHLSDKTKADAIDQAEKQVSTLRDIVRLHADELAAIDAK